MQIQIDFWQLMMAISSLVVTISGIVWTFGTLLVRQFKVQLGQKFELVNKDLQEKITPIETEIKSITKEIMGEIESIKKEMGRRAGEESELVTQMREFEKEFMKFQRDMPLQYVRREDYTRGQTVLEYRLDAIFQKLEVARLKGNINGNG